MSFSVKLLENVNNINQFQTVESVRLTRGNPYSLYFRVIQPTVGGLRYIPATGATGTVKFTHIDDTKKITRAATNPFAGDKSIWKVDILATDEIQFNSMTFELTDGTGPSAPVYKINISGDLVTDETDSRKFFC